MATSGILKKLVPLVPGQEMRFLEAEAFALALASWDPEGGSAPYADSFNAWKGTKLLGEVTAFLRQRRKGFAEEAGGDVNEVPCRANLFRQVFHQEVRGIVENALNLLAPGPRALVRAHFWGDAPLSAWQHKRLAECLRHCRHILLAQGYRPEDLIWDCSGARAASQNAAQRNLFAV